MKIKVENGKITFAKYDEQYLFLVSSGDNKIKIYPEGTSHSETILVNSEVYDLRYTKKHLLIFAKSKNSTFEILEKNVKTGETIRQIPLNIEQELKSAIFVDDTSLILVTKKQATLFNWVNQSTSIILDFDSLAVLSNVGYDNVQKRLQCIASKPNEEIQLVSVGVGGKKSQAINHLLGDDFSVYSEVYISTGFMYILNPRIEQTESGDLVTKIVANELLLIDLTNMKKAKLGMVEKDWKIIGFDENYYIILGNNEIAVEKILK